MVGWDIMKRYVKFSFWNSDVLMIDEMVEFVILNDYYVFKCNGSTFKFYLSEEKFHFIKDSKDEVFEIFKNSDFQECVVTLLSEKVSFDIKILDLEYKKEDKKYIIKYNIESDAEEDVPKTKIIILDFINKSS